MTSLGVYLQVPFCASKCSYCNFSSRVERDQVVESYCASVEKEIQGLRSFYAGQGIPLGGLRHSVDTVYFGGGTPPLAGRERLERIFRELERRFSFAAGMEVTLEAAPGSADEAFLAWAVSRGVNRLSIGAQTFDDRELRAVGRLHTADDTRRVVREARKARIENVNLDLIAGLPHQTITSWRHSLSEAVRLEPEHISVYLFEIDEKSRLGNEVLRLGERYHASAVPDDDFMADAYEMAGEFLGASRYTQYEISNFARPGFESRHNQKYWQWMPYVGLGAGAHSFDGTRRWQNVSSLTKYQKKLACSASPIESLRILSPQEQMEEFCFLGLRQRQGIDLKVLKERWGRNLARRQEARMATLLRDGWLEKAAGKVRLSPRALLVSNEIFQELLIDG